jgi:hypothetical protein
VNLAAGVVVVATYVAEWRTVPGFAIFSANHVYYGTLAILACSTFTLGFSLIAKSRAHGRHRIDYDALKRDRESLIERNTTLTDENALLTKQTRELSRAKAVLLDRNRALQMERNEACRALSVARQGILRFSQNERIAAQLTKQRMGHLNPLVITTRHRGEAVERSLAVIDFHIREELLALCDLIYIGCGQRVMAYVTAVRRLGDGPDRLKDATVEILYFEPTTGAGLNYLGEFDINAETSTMEILRNARPCWMSNNLEGEIGYRNEALPQWQGIINTKCAVPIAVGSLTAGHPVAMLTVDSSSAAMFREHTITAMELFASRLAPLLYSTRSLAQMLHKLSHREEGGG